MEKDGNGIHEGPRQDLLREVRSRNIKPKVYMTNVHRHSIASTFLPRSPIKDFSDDVKYTSDH